MIQNLKTEWLKIRGYRTFWVLIILFVVCTFGVDFEVYQFKKGLKIPTSLTGIVGSPFSFPDVWQTIAYLSSYLLFLPGLILLILITNEFTFRTHRQNIIDGQSRKEFVRTKVMLAVLLALFATLLNCIFTLIIGLMDGGGLSFTKSIYMLYFFLQALSYTFAGVLCGFLFKRAGLAIALYLLYLAFIKNIIAWLANHFLYGIGDYFPIKSADNLIPIPFLKSLAKQFITPPDFTALVICSLIYIGLFYFIVFRKFTTDDL